MRWTRSESIAVVPFVEPFARTKRLSLAFLPLSQIRKGSPTALALSGAKPERSQRLRFILLDLPKVFGCRTRAWSAPSASQGLIGGIGVSKRIALDEFHAAA